MDTRSSLDPTVVRENGRCQLGSKNAYVQAAGLRPARAVGVGIGHHGEILQGAFRDQDCRIHRGLVTLPCPIFNSIAWVSPRSAPSVDLDPAEKSKVQRAVALMLGQFGERAPGLSVWVRSNIPIGYGLGSSTADIVAALKATAAALGKSLSPAQLLEIAVAAEEASDGTMFTSRAVLTAHREGIVIEEFAQLLPPLGIISINCCPESPLLTLDFPPARYEPAEIDHFDELRRILRRAISNADQALLARVATESALINQRYIAQPGLPDVLDIACANGALGIQVAHSGRMVGVILQANRNRSDPQVSAIMSGLAELGVVPMFISRLQ
ncbi:GHMP kinase [Bradyrhizobium sp. 33ap4]|uniref:GHMP family kinase ATP-binding protein n=1 Tax=Bradyrhizobium sp. 33ap4 TaxID=3061630 RepID=UPI00292D51EE|nr:GHMP kinase [Bradyrhizobium sp. 33ap4]